MKEVGFADAPAVMDKLRAQGFRIVQCHGTFDLLHPGHLVHFEEARSLGDVLVVTLTAGCFVNKGPGRPFFEDAMRVKAVAALAIVDYVVAVPFPAAVEAIECIRPDVYCKGRDYEDPESDVTGNIRDDVSAVARVGGTVHYVGSVVFSSSRLINRAFHAVSKNASSFCRELSTKYTPDDFRAFVERFARLRVLVVGDLIFDRYCQVNVQGLTSKNRTLSARFIDEETQAGGALAIARHVAAFAGTVDVLSLAGPEPWVDAQLKTHLAGRTQHILRLPDFTTVVKQRFIESAKRSAELNKLFAVNYLDQEPPGTDVEEDVCRSLRAIIGRYDLVLVADFGHGLMQARVRELVQEEAPLLALNCQTNSFNHGFNLINRRYQRADFFSLDEHELMLACGQRKPDFLRELQALTASFDSRYAWLTRGSQDSIGIDARCGGRISVPPMESQVVDTVGAGDAFFSLVALAGATDVPIDLATFMGQLAGAQAVRIVGNSTSIKKDALLKGGQSLLAF